MSAERFAGLVAPLLTPFDDHGQPDSGRYVALAQQCLDEGCDLLAPLGTTGEALSLGLDERKGLVEALVMGGIAAHKLVVGVGQSNVPDTCDLIHHAQELGCAGVMVLPPFYYKSPHDDGLFDHFAALIEGTGGDDPQAIPLMLYHIPPVAVVGFSPQLVRRLRQGFPHRVCAIKDSSGDADNLAALLQIPGLRVFPGHERSWPEGIAGCVTASANINARNLARLWAHRHTPDEALRQQVLHQRACLQQVGMIPALKAILAQRTGSPSWQHVRPPLCPLPTEHLPALMEQMNAL